jgi:hypothetical protein
MEINPDGQKVSRSTPGKSGGSTGKFWEITVIQQMTDDSFLNLSDHSVVRTVANNESIFDYSFG